MENPLTKEQIEELNLIAKLPVEEQRRALQEFTRKLTPDQLNFLKNQQSGCVFCNIIEGKIESRKVYEDDKFLAVLDINPANKGHVLLFPKTHYDVLAQIQDIGELFNLANNIAKSIFESVKAEGTNIIVNNGNVAGQIVPHVAVNIIPRFKNDNVKIGWEKKDINEEEMNNICNEISKNILNKVVKKEKKKEETKIKVVKADKIDYLERMP